MRSGVCRRSRRNKLFRSGGIKRVGVRKKRKQPRERILPLAPVEEERVVKVEVEAGEVEEEVMPRQAAVVEEDRRRRRVYLDDRTVYI